MNDIWRFRLSRDFVHLLHSHPYISHKDDKNNNIDRQYFYTFINIESWFQGLHLPDVSDLLPIFMLLLPRLMTWREI